MLFPASTVREAAEDGTKVPRELISQKEKRGIWAAPAGFKKKSAQSPPSPRADGMRDEGTQKRCEQGGREMEGVNRRHLTEHCFCSSTAAGYANR